MIRAKELGGRAVVDVDAAEKLGRIDRVVLDPDGRRVAGFVVGRGSSIFNNDKDMVLLASCVHAVGPDAVTVHRGAAFEADSSLDDLPRVSDITGRKVVSDQGRLMGTVDDVLIDETDGRILGYALDDTGVIDKLRHPADAEGKHRGVFLRADANLRAGKDLIVAPEDAVSHDWDTLGTPQALAADAPRGWTSTPAGATALPDTQWIRTEGN